MSRCAICDEVSQKVKWRERHKEFQCDPCSEVIRDTMSTWAIPEPEGEERTLSEIAAQFILDNEVHVLEDAPAVPKVPVE